MIVCVQPYVVVVIEHCGLFTEEEAAHIVVLVRGREGNYSTVLVCWTADQQVE